MVVFIVLLFYYLILIIVLIIVEKKVFKYVALRLYIKILFLPLSTRHLNVVCTFIALTDSDHLL